MGKEKFIAKYDEDARREFLTGFHKRKVARRKQALEKQEELKREAKRQIQREKHREFQRDAKLLREIVFEEGPELGTSNNSGNAIEISNDEFSKKNLGASKVLVTIKEGMDLNEEENVDEALKRIASDARDFPSKPVVVEKSYGGASKGKAHRSNKGYLKSRAKFRKEKFGDKSKIRASQS